MDHFLSFNQSMLCLKNSIKPIKKREQHNQCLYGRVAFEKDIVGQKEICHPMLSQFAGGESLSQELTRTIIEMTSVKIHRSNIIALIDSMDFSTGFHKQALADVALCYNKIFFEEGGNKMLNVASLEKVRCSIRDQGPVLGLLSRNTLELKLCMSAQLNKNDFYRQSQFTNHRLEAIKKWILKEANDQAEYFIKMLALLAKETHKQQARRKPTITATIRLLGCDRQTADVLTTAYELLPGSPFATV